MACNAVIGGDALLEAALHELGIIALLLHLVRVRVGVGVGVRVRVGIKD